MTYGLVSLSIIMMIAVACPIITQLIPGKPMPQTVLLLVFGAIFGPFILDKIWVTKAVELLSELGLAFLFQLHPAIRHTERQPYIEPEARRRGLWLPYSRVFRGFRRIH